MQAGQSRAQSKQPCTGPTNSASSPSFLSELFRRIPAIKSSPFWMDKQGGDEQPSIHRCTWESGQALLGGEQRTGWGRGTCSDFINQLSCCLPELRCSTPPPPPVPLCPAAHQHLMAFTTHNFENLWEHSSAVLFLSRETPRRSHFILAGCSAYGETEAGSPTTTQSLRRTGPHQT